MAAASYNVGISGLQKQVTRQNVGNYYDLLLNEETGRYVYRILAAKEILSRPGHYGFHYRPGDLYPVYHYYEVEIDSAVDDFSEFALANKVNYKILKILNPWLRDSYLTNPDGKKYSIKLPIDTITKLIPVELSPEQKPLPDTLTEEIITKP
jgi:hypothetical protein